MANFNISEKCQKEWEQTLNVSNYKKIDDELSQTIATFLKNENPNNVELFANDIKKLIYKFAKILGVKINDVQFSSLLYSDMIGGYNDEHKIIFFNLNENTFERLPRSEILQTIIHELRHAQQSQIIRNFENSELAKTVDENFRNYERPTGKVIKNAKYFSNFNEIDAEIFSYVYIENILSQVKQNPKLAEYIPAIETAEHTHKYSHGEFKKQLDDSLKILEINNKAISAIKNGITNYSKLLFSNNGNLSKEDLDKQAEFLISQCEMLFTGQGKEFVDLTQGNFFAIQNAMYENADATQIVRHLDSPFIKYIEELEDRFKDLGLGKFNQHTRKLKNILEEGKKFLKAHNIKYNENDNGDIIKQIIENMPKVYLENLKNPTNDKQMQKDHDLSSLIDIYVTRDKNYLHLNCARYAEKEIPEKELRQLIENLVDKGISGTADFDMQQDLLSGYAHKYSSEKKWHTREEFLNFVGVRVKNCSFSEIYDKFEEAFPKFLAKCIYKKNLTQNEQKFITNFSLGVYGNIDANLLKENLEKQFFSKSKIKNLLENDNSNNPVIEALLNRKIDLIKLLENNNQEKQKQ